jgi:hypothetical protein
MNLSKNEVRLSCPLTGRDDEYKVLLRGAATQLAGASGMHRGEKFMCNGYIFLVGSTRPMIVVGDALIGVDIFC